MRSSVSWYPGVSTALGIGFFSSLSQFCCSGSGLSLAPLQTFLWAELGSSQGISSEWNWLFRLLTEGATNDIVWKPQATGTSWIRTHAPHLGGPNFTFSVCWVGTTFCGAPGAQRLDLWGLRTKQDTQATSCSLWVMLMTTELSMSKENPICAKQQLARLLSLDLMKCAPWQKAAVCFHFLFHWTRVFSRNECHPCVVWHVLIRGCWASCQEFINYKNRSSACALRQHVVSRPLMACVFMQLRTALASAVPCRVTGKCQ